jgi:23S rRNA (uracil1939-C5)-methyltransferase
MSTREKSSGDFEVTIEKLVFGGEGFARHQGKVVFVPFAVPGDRLVVRPVEDKKKFVRAGIVRILKPGKGRIDPACIHFAKCGGCHWQQLEYLRQVEAKRRILEEAFHHRFPETKEIPIVMRACTQPFRYRSRARIQLRGRGEAAVVGFFRFGSHTVEDVENCPLFRNSLNEALSSLRQYKLKVDTDSSPQEMDMACSEEEDAWATTRTGSGMDDGAAVLLGKRKGDDVILNRKVGEFNYSVTASVFFQANDFMIAELVALVRESAKDAGAGSALDLFSGVGLFSLPLARQFSEAIAVDNSPKAIELCARNARAAGMVNIQTVCSNVSSWVESLKQHARFDLVVLDPPRTGAGLELMETLREWAPANIIYVSCDPQTLVRDLAAVSPRDYRIGLVEGLDMFPQTYHFETVVRLERK